MALFAASLNSGSNGNCYYVGNHEDAILVDGGISCRETEKRLKRLGLNIRNVRAIFVSHEHGDHIHGIPVLSRKHRIPVYITHKTLDNGRLDVRPELIAHFTSYEPITIGDLRITAFPKIHDACDPHSFIISGDNVQIGVFTDIGIACDHVIKNFNKCHAAFLETNYDEGMLEHGRYPFALKHRIRSGKGHLSNVQAARLFEEHRPSYMTHLFLSHLSRDNNRPKIAQDLFKKIAGTTEIILAPRNKETRLYHIRNVVRTRSKAVANTAPQLGLFC
jgi:phosphoribosyl 1,2-cyclic phosphodiesterase